MKRGYVVLIVIVAEGPGPFFLFKGKENTFVKQGGACPPALGPEGKM